MKLECLDPRAGLDDVEKRKFLPLPGLVQPVASRYTDYAIPAPLLRFTPQLNLFWFSLFQASSDYCKGIRAGFLREHFLAWRDLISESDFHFSHTKSYFQKTVS
jgi:hypothetical protein